MPIKGSIIFHPTHQLFPNRPRRKYQREMKYLLSIILAVLLVTTEGKVVSTSDVENQQTDTQPPQLSDHIREAQNLINNLGAQLQQLNQKDLNTAIKEGTTNLVSNVQMFFKNMSDEVNSNHLHTRARTHAHTHTRTHAHTHAHTHTHTHTHTFFTYLVR